MLAAFGAIVAAGARPMEGEAMGEYFYVDSGADLRKVYEPMQSRLVVERRETEVTVCRWCRGSTRSTR